MFWKTAKSDAQKLYPQLTVGRAGGFTTVGDNKAVVISCIETKSAVVLHNLTDLHRLRSMIDIVIENSAKTTIQQLKNGDPELIVYFKVLTPSSGWSAFMIGDGRITRLSDGNYVDGLFTEPTRTVTRITRTEALALVKENRK